MARPVPAQASPWSDPGARHPPPLSLSHSTNTMALLKAVPTQAHRVTVLGVLMFLGEEGRRSKSFPCHPTFLSFAHLPWAERAVRIPSSGHQGLLVYAYQGKEEDFQQLQEQGINLGGAIALTRYGGAGRGAKVRAALCRAQREEGPGGDRGKRGSGAAGRGLATTVRVGGAWAWGGKASPFRLPLTLRCPLQLLRA